MRCTLSEFMTKFFLWISRSMYTSANTKHSPLQDAYLWILHEVENKSPGVMIIILVTVQGNRELRSQAVSRRGIW